MFYPEELKKVLIIGKVWPEPQSSAAGSRMIQLIDYFADSGVEIIFASAAKRGKYSADLSGKVSAEAEIEVNNSQFDSFMLEHNPDIVLFDRFSVEEQFGWRVAETCPDAIRILDTEDLHFLREARGRSAQGKQNSGNPVDYQNEVAIREIASVYRSDLSLVISDYEMNLLLNRFKIPANILLHLPFMLNPVTDDIKNERPVYSERSGFVTIGNFRHPPNSDSVIWLMEEIWPLIRKRMPEAEMNVYGAYLPKKIEMLNEPGDGFYVKGRASSSGKVIEQARVMLAPLRFGAGLKGKLIDAMRYGTPAVTTNVGAESMYGSFEIPGQIQDDPEKFADAAVELYNDENQWHQARTNGFRVINERYSKDEYEKLLTSRICEIWNDPESHRRNNFTGRMLMHHSMASTRYMSKWIEEKNKF